MQKIQIILKDYDTKSSELIFSTDIDIPDISNRRLLVKGLKDYIKNFAKETLPSDTLSTREVAEILEVSPATINGWSKKEGLPRIETRTGYPNRYELQGLTLWLKEHKHREYIKFSAWLDSQKQQAL